MSQTVETKLSRAKVALILDQPFFGALVTRLKVLPASDAPEPVPTMATDGTHLYYSDKFVESLSDKELQGVLAHEVLHCALLHPFRRGDRDGRKWNIVCDEAINEQLIASGFTLPKDRIDGPLERKGMHAEQRYTLIPEQKQGGKGKGKGKGKDGNQDEWNWGGVIDAPKKPSDDKQEGKGKDGKGKDKGKGDGNGNGEGKGEGEGKGSGDSPVMNESDWQIAAAQAEKVARSAGKMPGGLGDELRKTRESKKDWRATLRRFISSTVPMDYSWTRPNRRFISQGIYLPGVHKEGVGELVIAVDTSGSVASRMLDQFAAEIARIQSETRPEKIHVVYCDTRVFKTAEFTPDEEFQFEKKVARGGTYFQPVFDHVRENDIRPRALIYCTDLEPGDRPNEPGEYPVLWVVPDVCRVKSFAWGEVLEVELEGE